MKKRILFIAYYYPPLAGSGVFRPLKMIQYLREANYDVDVLTVENIDYHTTDESLLSESMANHIYRAKSYDPLALLAYFKSIFITLKKHVKSLFFNVIEVKDCIRKVKGKNKETNDNFRMGVVSNNKKRIINSFFPIDNKIGWLIPALNKADELFKQSKYDLVFTTIGPYTSALIGYRISNKYNIPLIIDYRDHWTLNTYQFDYNPFNKLLGSYFEKKILNHASLVSVIGNIMNKELCEKFLDNHSDKCITAYNGFEEKDFSSQSNDNNSKITTIRYLGSFNANRTVRYFIKALLELKESSYPFKDIIFEFYGNNDSQTKQLLNQPALRDLVVTKPLITHKESIEKICTADVLLLFISSEDGKGVLTGKLFEYIRSKNMILPMIKQNGEAKEILEKLGYHKYCAMEDVASIKHFIKEINEKTFNNTITLYNEIPYLSRENQCKKVIDRITELLNQTNPVRKSKR